VGIVLLVVLLQGVSGIEMDEIPAVVYIALVVSILYIIFSLIGWAFFGLPSYWLISKFTSGGYLYYLAAACMFALIAHVLQWQYPKAFSIAAFAQALLFRFYVEKET